MTTSRALSSAITACLALASVGACGSNEPADGAHVVAPAPAAPEAPAAAPAAEPATEPPKGVDAPVAAEKAKAPVAASTAAVAHEAKPPKASDKPSASTKTSAPTKTTTKTTTSTSKPSASKPSTTKTTTTTTTKPSSAPPAPVASAPKPQPPAPAPPPPAAKPATKVVVPHTDHVRIEVPKGLQAYLDADPRMQPWLGKVIKVVDTCYASTRKINPTAEGSIPIKLTMHANERPDADVGSVPMQLGGVVGCATTKLLSARPPLFTGKEGEKFTVRVHFEK